MHPQIPRAYSFLGFTLIELLVVIGIVGVLAGAVIAIINPSEQIARGNDSSRKAKITQLGKALEGYAIVSASYPSDATTAWMTNLVSSGELRALIPAVSGNKACAGVAVNNFCYDQGATTYVYTYIQSAAEAGKCSGGVGGAASTVYYVYDTSLGRACIKCGNAYTGACNAVQ